MNMQLVTTEKFNGLDCDFYRNMNDDILLTREQIGSALEYIDPMIAIAKIHDRHRDRLDQFSTLTSLEKTEGCRKVKRETILYTRRGIMEICRWSRQPKANIFMDFTWDVIDKIMHNEPVGKQIDTTQIVSMVTQQVILAIQPILTQVTQNQMKQKPKCYNSKWKRKISSKLELLSDYFDERQTTILSNLYIELENSYEIDLDEYQHDYCMISGLDNCPMLDVINNNKDLRGLFDCTIDNLLEKYNLSLEETCKRRMTIFD